MILFINFLIGDNSVDMIPPALDNGEPNSTMVNQIVYSQKGTILRKNFCTQIMRNYMMFDYIVLICFGALRSLSSANALTERFIIPI